MDPYDTFISASEDCPFQGAVPPVAKRSIAEVQYAMLVEQPYRFTQRDVLFASSAGMRENPEQPEDEMAEARQAFFSRPQACLRTSPLVKRWGWGIHFNSEGKAAAYAVGTDQYRRFSEDPLLEQTKGMRSKRE